MKKSYLLPNYFKKIGWLIFIPSIIYHFILFFNEKLDFKFNTLSIFPVIRIFKETTPWFSITETQFSLSILPILILTGLLFIVFSKEKYEDEYISKLREKSLVWSAITYLSIFVVSTLILYGEIYFYFYIMSIYLLFIIMIIKFHYELYKLKKSIRNEK